MGAFLWPLLGVMAGAFIAVQAPINAALGRGLGSPVVAAGFSFLSGAVGLALVSLIMLQAQGVTPNWRAPAAWMFVVGGLLGAVYVTSAIVLAPKIGAAALMACLVAGQLIAGILMDRVGFLGLPVQEISLGRIVGALMLLTGAVLVRFT